MNLTPYSYKSSWKSEHLWESAECIEVKEVGEFVNVRTITHSLASRILSALAALFTFGQVRSIGEKIRESRVIPLHLTDQQKDAINNILQENQPASNIRVKIEQCLNQFRVQQSPRNLREERHTAIKEEKEKGEDQLNKDEDKLNKDQEQSTNQGLPFNSPHPQPQNEALTQPILTPNPVVIEEMPAAPIIEEKPAPALPSFEEIQEQMALMREELRSILQQEKGQQNWLTDFYDKGCHLIVSWIPSTVLQWGKKAIETITIPVGTIEEDRFDASSMEQWEPIVDEFRELLAKFESLYPEQLAHDVNFQSLKSKLDETHYRFTDLHAYFDQCEHLTQALEVIGNQMADLTEGKLNFSPEGYKRIVQQITHLHNFPSTISSKDPQWKQRIEKKCLYQIHEAVSQIEDLMRDISDELSAEIEETKAHYLASQNPKNSFLINLQHLHQAEWMSKKIEKDITAFTDQLEILRKILGLPQDVHKRITYDLTLFQQMERKRQQTAPSFLQKLSLPLFKQLRRLPNAKEVLFKHLPENEAKRSQELLALEGLNTLAKSIEIGSKQMAIANEISKEASTLKSLDTEAIFENSLSSRPLLSAAKRKQRKKQLELINPAGLSPKQTMAWRAFFTYLQVWDIFSPAMRLLVEPVVKEDYQTCLSMMNKHKDNPDIYNTYLEKARGYWNADQEFLSMYDQYLKGNVTIDFSHAPRAALLKGTEPNQNDDSLALQAIKTITPKTLSTWLSNFLATEPDSKRLANAPEWERWSYYSLYPIYREFAFDAINKNFESMDILPPSENASPEQKRSYYFYQMYKHIKDPNGLEEFRKASTQAEAIWEYAPLAKEYHKYLLDQREAYTKPLEAILIETVPLGKAVLKILDREILSIQEHLQNIQNEKKYLRQVDLEAFESQRKALADIQNKVRTLNQVFSIEHAKEVEQTRWLRQIKNTRDRFLEQKPMSETTSFAVIWNEVISFEQLKLYLDSPAELVDEGFLAHALGETSLKGSSLETINSLKLQAHRLQLLQTRINSLKKLCIEKEEDLQGMCAGFCNEYMNNPQLVKQVGELSFIPSLEQLIPKIGQAIELSELFFKADPSKFYASLADKLSHLKTEESLFFVDPYHQMAYELIYQKNGYYSLRIYNQEAPAKFHTRLIDAEGKERALPFTEFVDISYRRLSNKELWNQLHSLSSSTNSPDALYEHMLSKTGGSFSDKVYESTSLIDPAATSPSAYQLITTLFREQKIAPTSIDRFEFESQLKILKSYHEQNKELYSQEAKHLLMLQAKENYASKLPEWHRQKIITDEELHFTTAMLKEIDHTLNREQINAIDTYAKTLPIFHADQLQSTPLTLPKTVASTTKSNEPTPVSIEERVKDITNEFKYEFLIDIETWKPTQPNQRNSLDVYHKIYPHLIQANIGVQEVNLLCSYVPWLAELVQIKLQFIQANRDKNYDYVLSNFQQVMKKLLPENDAPLEISNSRLLSQRLINTLNLMMREFLWSKLHQNKMPHEMEMTPEETISIIKLIAVADKLTKEQPSVLNAERLHTLDFTSLPLFQPEFISFLESNPTFSDPEWRPQFKASKKYWEDKQREHSVFGASQLEGSFSELNVHHENPCKWIHDPVWGKSQNTRFLYIYPPPINLIDTKINWLSLMEIAQKITIYTSKESQFINNQFNSIESTTVSDNIPHIIAKIRDSTEHLISQTYFDLRDIFFASALLLKEKEFKWSGVDKATFDQGVVLESVVDLRDETASYKYTLFGIELPKPLPVLPVYTSMSVSSWRPKGTELLIDLNHIEQEFKSVNDHAAILRNFPLLIKKMSFADPLFWNQINTKDIPEIIYKLNTIAQDYLWSLMEIKNHDQVGKITPKESLTWVHLLIIADKLNRMSLKDHYIPMVHSIITPFLNEDPSYSRFDDPELQEMYVQAKDYWKDKLEEKSIFVEPEEIHRNLYRTALDYFDLTSPTRSLVTINFEDGAVNWAAKWLTDKGIPTNKIVLPSGDVIVSPDFRFDAILLPMFEISDQFTYEYTFDTTKFDPEHPLVKTYLNTETFTLITKLSRSEIEISTYNGNECFKMESQLPPEYFALRELYFTFKGLYLYWSSIKDKLQLQKKVTLHSKLKHEIDSNVDTSITFDYHKFASSQSHQISSCLAKNPIKFQDLISYGHRLCYDGFIKEFAQEYGIDYERSIDLFALVSVRELQIQTTLSFFSSHSLLLHQKNYQELFYALIFEGDLLFKELQNRPAETKKLVDGLATLCRLGVSNAKTLNDPSTMAFFLNLNHRLSTIIRQHLKNPHIKIPSDYAPEFIDTRKEITELKKLFPDESSSESLHFQKTLIDSYAVNQEFTADEAIEFISTAMRYRLLVDQVSHKSELKMINDLFKAKSVLLEHLFVGPERDNILDGIFVALHPDASPPKWDAQSKFPNFRSQDDQIRLNLLEGKIKEHGQEDPVKLPLDITSDPLFIQLFKTPPLITWKLPPSSQLNNEEVYAFVGPGGRTHHVTKNFNNIRVESEFDGVMHIYVEGHGLDQFNLPAALIHGHHHWYHPKTNNFVIADSATGAIKYYLSTDPQASTSKYLRVGKLKSNDAYASILMRIEQPQWIIASQDRTSQVKKIEFPRYGLDFSLQEIESTPRFVSAQLEGYYLAEKQLLPALGNSDNYLVLETKTLKGQLKQRVLFPNTPLESLKDSLHTHTKAKFPDEFVKLSCIIYDVNPINGQLVIKTTQERFFLAMMHLWEHHYESAFILLNHELSQLKAYSQESIDLLNRISHLENKDSHPKAYAVRLKALAIGLRNHIDFASSAKNSPLILNQDYDQVLNDYAHYLQVKDQARTVRLTREEEILLIRTCQHRLDPQAVIKHQQIAQRMKEFNLPEELSAPNKITIKPFGIHPKIDFTQISLNSLYPEGKTFDTQFLDMYPYIRISEQLSKDNILQLISLLTGEKPSFFFSLWPLSFQQLRLHWALQLKQEEAKTPEEALPYLVLEAALLHPEKLPVDLNFLKTTAPSHEKSDWIRTHLLFPLQSMIEKQEVSKGMVKGIPQKLESIKHPAPQLKEMEYEVSLPISQAASPQRLPIDPDKLVNTTLPSFIPIEQASKKLLNLFNVDLKDAIARQEVDALKTQITEFVTSDPEAIPPFYTLKKEASLHETSNTLRQEAEGIRERLEQYKKSIVKLANRQSEDKVKQSLEEIKHLAGQNTSLNLDEIILIVLKRDASFLHAYNEALTLEDLTKLSKLVIGYLILNTHQQRLIYLDQLTQSVIEAPNPAIAEERTQILGEELHRSRAYDIAAHPEYLILESASGILLREKQVKGLDYLNIVQGVIGAPQHLGKALELIMGAGKTSVFAPLISMLNSDGVHLALLVMPHSLIESMSKDLQNTLGEAFHTALEIMSYMRSSEMTIESLTRINDRLKGMIVNRSPLIISNESLKALFLKMSEKIKQYHSLRQEGEDTTSIEREMTLFLDIFRTLKTSGHVLVDEVDLILDVLKSFHFTIGKPQDIDPILASTTLDLYRHLVKIADSLPLRFKFLKQKNTSLPPFSPEAYHKEVKPELVKQILKGEFITAGEKWKAYIASMTIPWTFFTDNSKDTAEKKLRKNMIEAFLYGNSAPEVIEYIKSIEDRQIQDILATLKEQLNVLIPLAAPKNSLEHYGPQEGKGYAKPYHYGKPSPDGTQYGTEIETLDYTCQWHLEHGISLEVCRNYVNRVAEEIAIEMQYLSRPLQELPKYRDFMEFTDHKFNPLDIREGDIEKIQRIINARPAKILDMVQKYVIPTIEAYESQLNADAQLFGVLFNQIQGMSGTLWNTATFTKLITTIFPSKTAAKTLLLLSMNSPQKVEKIPALKLYDDASVKNAIELALKPTIDRKSSLIDSSKFFKGIPNKVVAQQLLLVAKEHNWGIKGITYYSEDHKLMVITHENQDWKAMELSESNLTREEIAAFWDQAHCTGSDIKLNPSMEAAIFINEHSMLRDLLQSVWRLRELDKKQKVHCVVSDEDTQIIQAALRRVTGLSHSAELTLNDVILYTLIQQTSRQGSDNYRSLKQKFNAVLLNKTLTSMLEASSAAEMAEIYEATKDLFEMTQVTRPSDLFVKSSKISAREVVVKNDLEKFLKGPLMETFRTHPLLSQRWNAVKIAEEIQALADSEIKNMPHTLEEIDTYGKERSVQTATQTQQQTQINIELLKQAETIDEDVIKKRGDIHTDLISVIWPSNPKELFYASYFTPQSGRLITTKTYLSLAKILLGFDSDILWSESLTHKTREYDGLFDNIIRVLIPYHPYSSIGQGTYFNQMLLIQNKQTKKLQALLISPQDAKHFKEMLLADRKPSKDEELNLAIYDLNTGIYIQGNDVDRFDEEELKTSKEFLSLKVQAKFLHGDIYYAKSESEALKEWMIDSRNPEDFEWFFLRIIAPWRGVNNTDYKKSDIAAIFREFKNWEPPPIPPGWFASFWKPW